VKAAIASAAKLATSVLSDAEPCQWVIAGEPTVGDPTKPWIKTAGEPTTHDVAILFKATPSSPYLQANAGSSVETGAVKAIMADVDFVPSISDTVVRSDGTKLSIKSVTPLNMNGQIVLYYLTFSK
jgi:hypothetical protein